MFFPCTFTAEKSEVLLADCVSPVPFSRTPWSLQSLRIGDWLQRLNRPTFNPFRGHDVLDVASARPHSWSRLSGSLTSQ